MKIIRLASTVVFGLLAWGVASAQGGGSQDDRAIMEQSNGSSSGGTDTGAPPVEDELSTTYSSIGLQKVTVDVPGYDVTDAVNLDFTLVGFRIPPAPWFAVELNLGTSIIPGEIKQSGSSGTTCPLFPPDPFCNATSGSSGQTADLGVTTIGAWAVLRSTGSVFVMGKVGYRYLGTNIEGFPENRTGNGYGGGIGYRWNKKGSYAELNYIDYGEDIKGLGFSVSYSYDRR